MKSAGGNEMKRSRFRILPLQVIKRGRRLLNLGKSNIRKILSIQFQKFNSFSLENLISLLNTFLHLLKN